MGFFLVVHDDAQLLVLQCLGLLQDCLLGLGRDSASPLNFAIGVSQTPVLPLAFTAIVLRHIHARTVGSIVIVILKAMAVHLVLLCLSVSTCVLSGLVQRLASGSSQLPDFFFKSDGLKLCIRLLIFQFLDF